MSQLPKKTGRLGLKSGKIGSFFNTLMDRIKYSRLVLETYESIGVEGDFLPLQ